MENFKEMMDYMEASPLFNLSLTNKELFHSNFLAWFGKQYPDKFKTVIDNMLGGMWPKDLDKYSIDREYKHFDLCVRDTQGKVRIVIENKVKSVPTKKQLEQYQKEVGSDSCLFILLSMTSHLHDWSDVERWKCVTYCDLAKQLECINIHKPYHASLLDDYRQYVKCLQRILEEFDNDNGNYYNNKKEDEVLNKLGIHDIAGKRKAQILYRNLFLKCKEKGWDVVPKVSDLSENNMMVGWGFTNSQPLIEVKFKKGEDIIIIQIQGGQYRHAIEYFDKSIGSRIIKEDKEYKPSENGLDYLSKTYPDIISFSETKQPKNFPIESTDKFGKKKNYCKFCNGRPDSNGDISCFVYQWIPIPHEIKINGLIELIIKDIESIKNLLAGRKPI